MRLTLKDQYELARRRCLADAISRSISDILEEYLPAKGNNEDRETKNVLDKHAVLRTDEIFEGAIRVRDRDIIFTELELLHQMDLRSLPFVWLIATIKTECTNSELVHRDKAMDTRVRIHFCTGVVFNIQCDLVK